MRGQCVPASALRHRLDASDAVTMTQASLSTYTTKIRERERKRDIERPQRSMLVEMTKFCPQSSCLNKLMRPLTTHERGEVPAHCTQTGLALRFLLQVPMQQSLHVLDVAASGCTNKVVDNRALHLQVERMHAGRRTAPSTCTQHSAQCWPRIPHGCNARHDGLYASPATHACTTWQQAPSSLYSFLAISCQV